MNSHWQGLLKHSWLLAKWTMCLSLLFLFRLFIDSKNHLCSLQLIHLNTATCTHFRQQYSWVDTHTERRLGHIPTSIKWHIWPRHCAALVHWLVCHLRLRHVSAISWVWSVCRRVLPQRLASSNRRTNFLSRWARVWVQVRREIAYMQMHLLVLSCMCRL